MVHHFHRTSLPTPQRAHHGSLRRYPRNQFAVPPRRRDPRQFSALASAGALRHTFESSTWMNWLQPAFVAMAGCMPSKGLLQVV